CPAWINSVEQDFPEFIPNLSSCKSPMMMLGRIVKQYWAEKAGIDRSKIFQVAIMPCTAKKMEIERQQMLVDGDKDVDAVLTTRELGALIRKHHIKFSELEDSEFDCPLGTSTGAAVIFGVTGGVMEAALRTAYEVTTKTPLPTLEYSPVRGVDKNIKVSTVELPLPDGNKKTIKVGVCNGIKAAHKLLADIKSGEATDFDFIEVMSCPGGCIGGGGQPRSLDPEILKKRSEATYTCDERSAIRRSHENPTINKLYEEYYEEPNSHKAHHDLHTHYTDRSAAIIRPIEEEEEEEEVVDVDGTPLLIVYATQTGNCKEVAQRIAAESKTKDINFAPRVKSIDKITFTDIPKASLLVYVTSTFGMGEHPDMGQPFMEWLDKADHPNNLFGNTKFGVFGLGSSSYKAFCAAALEVDERVVELGAKRLVPCGKGDELHAEKYEGALGPWLEAFWESLGASEKGGVPAVPEPKYAVLRTTSMNNPPPAPTGFQYASFTYKEKIVPETAEREAFRFDIDISECSLEYKTGYHIGIMPRNADETVAKFCEFHKLNPEECVVVQQVGSEPVPTGLKHSLSIYEIFSQYKDLQGPVSRSFLKRLIPFADSKDREVLERLVSKEGIEEFTASYLKEGINFGEIWEYFPSVRPSLEFLIELVPSQKSRLYSIASSDLMHPDVVELVIGLVSWKTPKGVVRYGATTSYLKSLDPAKKPRILCTIKSSPLCPPTKTETPYIMVGLGSGIAPFRGWMQERQMLKEQGKPLGKAYLLFGCRRRSEDFLCGDELEKWDKEGLVELRCAFSREIPGQKVYCPHLLQNDPMIVKNCLFDEDGGIYYCGITGLPQTLMDIVRKQFGDFGLTEKQIEERVELLEGKGQMIFEAW
ncbi:NADPH fad oxidoreductase, putative, partial [Aduncisulcus paluster]